MTAGEPNRARGRIILAALGVAVATTTAYLLLWPVPLEPESWTPPHAPHPSANAGLAGVEVLEASLPAPEAVTFDAEGRIVTGLLDGRIVRFTPHGHDVTVVTQTGGRPAGLKYDRAGRLIVADAYRGLLAIGSGGNVETLAAELGGQPLRLVDDLDIGKDGTIYFSDASARWPLDQYKMDIIEHRPSGRLLVYRPDRRVELVLGGLYFANGVALSPDESYVLVAETTSYRIRRIYLRGPNAGQDDIFLDNLPGFPDNITWSPARRAFWIALAAPREPAIDVLAPWPFARKVLARLPELLQPAPKRHGWALAVDEAGRTVADLQDVSPTSYSPLTSVIERDGFLYLGSFVHHGVGRVRAPE
jgi:sugar lactone lactonase YvrE